MLRGAVYRGSAGSATEPQNLTGLRPSPMAPRMRIRSWMIVASFTACVAPVACGGDREKHTARPVTPIDPATTGTVEVDVRFDGTPPPLQELRMSSVAECASQHQGPVLAGDMLAKDGKVENAFVY